MPEKATQKHCAYCRAILFEDDDVVWCPECGAPHHRACYQELGHCARIDKHGLPEPEPEPPVEETPVTEEIPEPEPEPEETATPFAAFDPAQAGGPFDPYNGVDPEGEVDGLPVTEVATFVRVNTRHYLPRFSRMCATGRKVSWNLGGFLFGPTWLFYRKCYAEAIGATLLSVASTLMMSPFLSACYDSELIAGAMTQNPWVVDPLAEAQASAALIQLIGQKPWAFLLCLLGFLITVALHLLTGLFGTRIYLRRCLAKVRLIREDDEIDNKLQALLSAGGVSLVLALVSIYGVPLLMNLIRFL